MDERPHAVPRAREAPEEDHLGAPRRHHRGRQGLAHRADAQGKAAGDGKAGEEAVRTLYALLLALVFCTAACLSAAQDIIGSFDELDPATHETDYIAQFNSTEELSRFCDKSKCHRSWDGVVHAALVARGDSTAMASAQSANASITYNSPIRAGTRGRRLLDYGQLTLGPFEDGCMGSDVHVYILDTGVLRQHEEFRIFPGLYNTSRVFHDFNSFPDENDEDCNGHGTHVAGILGGLHVGKARNVTMHSVKILDCAGEGEVSDLLDGLQYVYMTDLIRPALVSISVGLEVQNDVLDSAITNLVARQLQVFVAAGNDGNDACYYSMADAKDVFAVGAVDSAFHLTAFTNYGTCVKLFADGVAINSSFNTGLDAFATLSGTSMATPLVAGIAACMLERDGTLNATALTAELLNCSVATAFGNILKVNNQDERGTQAG